VDTAHNGEDAVSRFSPHKYDLVFMDVKLPGMDGVESFLEIRKLEPEARVVMMTGYSVEDLLRQAVDNGACGVLYKPFGADKVVDYLKTVKKEELSLIMLTRLSPRD
jgi:YesN/AraC family two-component response regulator